MNESKYADTPIDLIIQNQRQSTPTITVECRKRRVSTPVHSGRLRTAYTDDGRYTVRNTGSVRATYLSRGDKQFIFMRYIRLLF